MCASILGFQAPLLRAIAEQLGLPLVSEIARQVGVSEVYRITVLYFDGRFCNSVATLVDSQVSGAVLEIVYQRALNNQPISHAIRDMRYVRYVKALRGIPFDQMRDQPNLPDYNSTDLWLVERAAGTFSHSVIVAPAIARDRHNRLVNAVKHGLPEALRMVK